MGSAEFTIRNALRELEKAKCAEGCWQAWTLEANFAAYARKHFAPGSILAQPFVPAEAFAGKTQKLAVETKKMKKMQTQRQR